MAQSNCYLRGWTPYDRVLPWQAVVVVVVVEVAVVGGVGGDGCGVDFDSGFQWMQKTGRKMTMVYWCCH